jgi:hypothetical protein
MNKKLEIADDFFSRKELAEDLGNRLRGKPYSEPTLIAWEKAGKGPPATRVGRDVLYYKPSVEQWLRSRETAANSTDNETAPAKVRSQRR